MLNCRNPSTFLTDEVAQVARRLLRSLKAAIAVGSEQVFASASLGGVVYPPHGDDARTLVEKAEPAMHEAQRFGGGAAQASSATLETEAQQRLKLAPELGHAA
jgi:predicted signal transduction protein with EAL and GGDEF domain